MKEQCTVWGQIICNPLHVSLCLSMVTLSETCLPLSPGGTGLPTVSTASPSPCIWTARRCRQQSYFEETTLLSPQMESRSLAPGSWMRLCLRWGPHWLFPTTHSQSAQCCWCLEAYQYWEIEHPLILCCPPPPPPSLPREFWCFLSLSLSGVLWCYTTDYVRLYTLHCLSTAYTVLLCYYMLCNSHMNECMWCFQKDSQRILLLW